MSQKLGDYDLAQALDSRYHEIENRKEVIRQAREKIAHIELDMVMTLIENGMLDYVKVNHSRVQQFISWQHGEPRTKR